ncbi:M78 family metallopeptidase domain-containing protein [Enterococcus sp. LJL128]
MNNVELLMTRFPQIEFEFDKKMPKALKGLYLENKIYLNPHQTQAEMFGTVAEEVAHHYTSAGERENQDDLETRKQEWKARLVGSELIAHPVNLIAAKRYGCKSQWETAEFLGITVEHLQQALRLYKEKYGTCFEFEGYVFDFGTTDTLNIYKLHKKIS